MISPASMGKVKRRILSSRVIASEASKVAVSQSRSSAPAMVQGKGNSARVSRAPGLAPMMNAVFEASSHLTMAWTRPLPSYHSSPMNSVSTPRSRRGPRSAGP